MSLRTSITLLVIAVAIGAGLGSSFLVSHMMHEALEEELQNQAVVAVQSLALHITHNVINGEVVGAQDGLLQLIEHSPSIKYAYIFDFDGRLFAHSFGDGFPRELAEGLFEHHTVSVESPEVRHFSTDSGRILEIGYPLIDGMKGHVHIGLDEGPMQARISTLRTRIIGLTLLFAITGIALGIFMSRRLANPLSELADVMRNLDSWDKDVDIDLSHAGVEVANLSQAFNRMISDRRQDQQLIRDSEERLQAVYEAADNVAFVTTDLGGTDTRILRISPGAEKIFGYKEEEIIGQRVAIFHNDNMVEKFPEMQDAIREGRKGHQGETVLVRKSGEVFPAIFTIHPLLNAAGELVGTLGVTIDITERKKIEKALKESEDRFWSLFENAPMGYQSLNVDGEFLEVNDTWCQMTGFTREEIYGQNFSVFLHPESIAVFEKNFPNFLEHGFIQGAEFRIVKKDGTELIVSLDGKTESGTGGSVKQTHCVLKDITQSKLTEEAIKREKEKAETYLKMAGVMMVALDTQGVVTMINNRGCNILGFDESEIIGKVWFDHFIPQRLVNSIKPVSDQLLENNVDDAEFFENPVLTRSGEERLISWHNSVLKNINGEVIGHLSAGEDITEKEKLRAELMQAQKMESIGRLAGGVAHDFNNMLGVILGYSEMARNQVDPSQPLYAALTGIQTAAERSSKLTRQLLAFARKQTIAPRVLDLNEAVGKAMILLDRLIGDGIELIWKPETELWPVKVDSSQIDQILINLCVNARDAIEGVGKITIETMKADIGEAECAGHAGAVPGQYVVLTVCDNGHGMDAETLSKLFEPFFTTKAMGKGTGLGLAMILGAVEQNAGFVNVESEPGQGTSFKIFLPRQRAEIEPLPEKTTGSTVATGRETILLVEDEPLILEMANRMLMGLGYTVLPAASPLEAIQIARDHSTSISLICTDVIMSEMSGLELIKNLKPILPDLKCLYMSGYTADVIAEQGILQEGIQFIQKPFTMGDLGAKIRETLDSQ